MIERSASAHARNGIAIGIALALAGGGLVLAAAPAEASTNWIEPIPIFSADTTNLTTGDKPSLSADGMTASFLTDSANFNTPQPATAISEFDGTAWGSSVQVSPSNISPSDPVISQNGNAVVYTSRNSSNFNNAAGSKKASGTWTPQTETLFTSPASDNGAQYITVSDDGGRIAWKSNINDDIMAASWNAAGVPGEPQLVADADGNNTSVAHPMISGNGMAIAYEGSDSDDHVYVARLVDGAWVSKKASDADIDGLGGISADGNAVVWQDDSDDFLYGSTWNGSDWTTPQLISPDSPAEEFTSDGYSDVAADGSVLWKDDDTDQGFVSQFRDGAWQIKKEISPNFNSGTLSGDGTTVFFKPDPSPRALTVVDYINGEWGAPEEIVASGTGTDDLRISADGQAVAWTSYYIQNDTLFRDIKYSRRKTPAAPSGIQATAAAKSAVVTWTKASAGAGPVTGYEVATYFEGNLVSQTCTVAAPTLTCTVPGLDPGKAYTFKVRAKSAAGDSGYSQFSNPVEIPADPAPAPSTDVAMKFVNVPANVVIGQRVKWNLNVTFKNPQRAARVAKPNGSADVFLRGSYQCTAKIVNGLGSCIGTIPSLGQMRLTAKFTGTGGDAGAEADANTKTSAATVSIAAATVRVGVNAGTCRAYVNLSGLAQTAREDVTVQRLRAGKWVPVGTTKSSAARRWSLQRIGLTATVTRFRVTDGETTNVPVTVTIKGLQTRGC